MIPETVAAIESHIVRPSHLSLIQDADLQIGYPFGTEIEGRLMNTGHFEQYEHVKSAAFH